MWMWLNRLPFFVMLMGIGSIAMLIPAGYAFGSGDLRTARVFFYGTILGLFLTLLIGLATSGYVSRSVQRSQLTGLLGAFGLLPLLFAIPFYEAAGQTTVLHAWFEMISSFTTTGATLYDNAGRLSPALHLWRSLVGWMGGLLVWITAATLLAPMNLGGFEVRAVRVAGDRDARSSQLERTLDPSAKLQRISLALASLYMGLTAVLWIGLTLLGDTGFVALCHAMAVLSTSGISPVHGLYQGGSGIAGEVLIAVFLLLALTRIGFNPGQNRNRFIDIWFDPEFRLGLSIVAIVCGVLMLRHFIVADAADITATLGAGLLAFWGALFTALSFLTTMGFESGQWLNTKDWAGLQSPGLILLGLSLIGGGVATTAGGLKLLRVYALSRHGLDELERIIHPSSVAGSGEDARRIRSQGAYIAWVFFVLFVISVAGVMLLLALTGLQFEPSMVLTIAALTTTGPLAEIAGENPVAFSGIPDSAKMILAVTMILGRMETLALIALLNPEFWRS